MLRIRRQASVTSGARLWAEIDLDAVRDNVRTLRSRLASGCELLAVVKANGYGHGAVPVARAALEAGATGLAVADVAEAARLREAGISASVRIVGPTWAGDVGAILRHRLLPAIADLDCAQALARAAGGPVAVEIEVDTGMRRHGVPVAGVAAFLQRLRELPALRPVGLYTHFAGVGAADLAAMRAQWDAFCAVSQTLRASGWDLKTHACNSLAMHLLPEAHADAVRIGGALYGFECGLRGDTGLRPALQLCTSVVGLRSVQAGDRVGYAGAHHCASPTTLALLPCGYADGLSGNAWAGAEVLIRGRRAPIVGRISMNQITVDVGDVPRVETGDEVVLLGVQQDQRLRPEDRARRGISPYEVTAMLRAELPRRYRGAVSAGAVRR